MAKELSLIDAAVEVMTKDKKAFELYELFDRIVELLDIPKSKQEELVTKFYSDLTTSAKFIYVGDNQWNLKANEKIELWEKDGSFYKEYTVVELPDEYKVDPFAKPKKTKSKPTPTPTKKDVVEVEDVTPEVVEEEVVEEPVVVEEKVVEPVVEPVAEDKKKTDEVEEEYEEEVFDDYDDFDEEKYNEYMDNYEDQYDD